MANHAWLKCAVHPGSLSGELAIEITTADGHVLSLFLPAESVRKSSGNQQGEIPVDVLDRDADFGLVSLPRRTIEGGSVAKVRAQSLSFG